MAILVACAYCACSPAAPSATHANTVAVYLDGAERQSETDLQRREIQRALHDMLEKSPAELRQVRYADYSGEVGRWSVTELLRHYFVPRAGVALDERRFFEEFREPAARAVIQRQLDAVNRTLQ